MLLTATDGGRQRLQETNTAGVRLFQRALDGWSDPDRRALAALMQRFVDDLTDVPQHSNPKVRQRI